MKSFEYAKNKENKKFKMPVVKMGEYRVYLWALPIAPFAIAYDKLQTWAYNRRVWNDKKATKVLDYVLPYILEYVEEDNAYYYCMDWGTYNLWKKAPIISRAWARKFSNRLQHYIKDYYEKEGFVKTVESDGYDTWVKFVEK